MPTKPSSAGSRKEVWVLLDPPSGSSDLAQFAGPQRIDVSKLGEHLRDFTSAMADVIKNCATVAGDFKLSEVTLGAKLSAEGGFVLVAKAGVEGAIELKFTRKG
jgi:hypothetical protein